MKLTWELFGELTGSLRSVGEDYFIHPAASMVRDHIFNLFYDDKIILVGTKTQCFQKAEEHYELLLEIRKLETITEEERYAMIPSPNEIANREHLEELRKEKKQTEETLVFPTIWGNIIV